MPLTEFQAQIAKLLSSNKTPEAYLAGGAALHIEPNSKRYSNDLDFFHDSEERVQETFEKDSAMLSAEGFTLEITRRLPGFIRASAARGDEVTKIEWVHDTAWRFMPVLQDDRVGYRLHPIDVAINKILALAGRSEPRDFIDTLEIVRNILPLGAICWAAAAKDPGFTPLSLLELVRRKGSYRPEDFRHLEITEELDLIKLKSEWLAATEEAEEFINRRPADEIGCLYYCTKTKEFVAPSGSTPLKNLNDIEAHYGRPGGVLPKVE